MDQITSQSVISESAQTNTNVAASESEISGWNWGAALLTPFWGLGHRIWWSVFISGLYILLSLYIPYSNSLIGPIVFVYFGMEGNRLARQNRPSQSIEQFKRTERMWAYAAFIIVPLWLLVSLGYSVVIMSALGGRFYNPFSGTSMYQFSTHLILAVIIGYITSLIIRQKRKVRQ